MYYDFQVEIPEAKGRSSPRKKVLSPMSYTNTVRNTRAKRDMLFRKEPSSEKFLQKILR